MADTSELREQLLTIDAPVFAVVDGAQFDDLPSALFDGNFVHRSLYLDRGVGDSDRDRTAPQLVWLNRETEALTAQDMAAESPPIRQDVLDRLLDLIGDRPAAVFWVCEVGGEALFRHLRTLNMVLIPKSAEVVGSQDDTHDLVVFRHADANVMMQVFPALRSHHAARLFGPASKILFAPDEEWGDRFNWAARPDDPPPAKPGPLKLEKVNIARIEEKRLAVLRARRAAYLRDTCKDETAGASDEIIAEHIRVSEKLGSQIGLISEAAHCRWAFIMCKTGGKILHEKDAIRFIRNEGDSPDDQVRKFIEGMASYLEKRPAKGVHP